MAYLYPPSIIERSSRGERSYDIFSRLLMDRIVFLGAPINDDVASIIIAQLLFLDADNPDKDIHLYINSPGGIVASGMAIYDTMQHLRAPVGTICMGMAASMGAFLLAAGTKGKRSALPHSRILIHQPSGGTSGHGGRHRDPGAGDHLPAYQDEPADGVTLPARRSRRSRRTWTGIAT